MDPPEIAIEAQPGLVLDPGPTFRFVTVVSLVTLSLVAGAAFPQAARLANYGASVVVMKPGTAPPCASVGSGVAPLLQTLP